MKKLLAFLGIIVLIAIVLFIVWLLIPIDIFETRTARFDELPSATPTYNWPTANPTSDAKFQAMCKARGVAPARWYEYEGKVYQNFICDCGSDGGVIGACECDDNVVVKPYGTGAAIATVNPTIVPQCAYDGYVIPYGLVTYVAMTVTVTPSIVNHTTTPTASTTPDPDCLYQDWPVGGMMPIIPECDERRLIVQWNGYVRPNTTTWEYGIPRGLRGRTCPTLYTNQDEKTSTCQAIETDYAYCPNPAFHQYNCTSAYMYVEQVIYREPIPELGWYDWGYFARTNKWNWKPFCVWFPSNPNEMKCYTDWRPSQAVITSVEKWKAAH